MKQENMLLFPGSDRNAPGRELIKILELFIKMLILLKKKKKNVAAKRLTTKKDQK